MALTTVALVAGLASAFVSARASVGAVSVLVAGATILALVDGLTGLAVTLEALLAVALEFVGAGGEAFRVLVARARLLLARVVRLAGLAVTLEAGFASALEGTGGSLSAHGVLVARSRGLLAGVDFLADLAVALVASLALANVSAGTSLGAGCASVARRRLVLAVVDSLALHAVSTETLLASADVSAGASLGAESVLVARGGDAVVLLNAFHAITGEASFASASERQGASRGAVPRAGSGSVARVGQARIFLGFEILVERGTTSGQQLLELERAIVARTDPVSNPSRRLNVASARPRAVLEGEASAHIGRVHAIPLNTTIRADGTIESGGRASGLGAEGANLVEN